MKVMPKDMLMYVITDRKWLGGRNLAEEVEKSIKGGATFIQVREKDISHNEFLKVAREVKQVTDKYNIPLVINDNIEIAVEIGADGVHIGQEDEDINEVRKKLGNNKIIGLSVQTKEQAILGEKMGADYLGVGSMFKTNTKSDAKCIELETLRDIKNAVEIPIVTIGGIDKENILKMKGYGADGISVISAIFSKKDPYLATKELKELAKEIVDYEI